MIQAILTVALAARAAAVTSAEAQSSLTAIVQGLSQTVLDGWASVTADTCPAVDACSDDLVVAPSDDFASTVLDGVNLEIASVFYPETTGPDAEDANQAECAASGLERDMRDKLGDPGAFHKWSYYADQTSGIFYAYPGNEGHCDDVDPYDPRFRPWYAAAATGPKDLVLVLDMSGSMTERNRRNQAVDAGKAVIDTLTAADYATVVAFNDGTTQFSSSMVQMTDANRARVKDWLDGLSAVGRTNFELAFQTAFDVLDTSKRNGDTTSCNSIMLFMTDGVYTEGSDPSSLIEERNQGDISVRIFTYSFGEDAETTLMKDTACANDGVWFQIADGTDELANIMAEYYTYLAAGISSSTVRWSEPYIDGLGLGEMTTACLPVFDTSSESTNVLRGVVCADVLLEDIDAGELSLFLSQIEDETQGNCPDLALSDEQLEVLRGDDAACGTGGGGGGGGGDGGDSTGVIVGVIVGVVILVVIAAIIFFRRQASASQKSAAAMSQPPRTTGSVTMQPAQPQQLYPQTHQAQPARPAQPAQPAQPANGTLAPPSGVHPSSYAVPQPQQNSIAYAYEPAPPYTQV